MTTRLSLAFIYQCRACPGIHFAHAMMFLNIAHVLSVFDIRPCTSAEGEFEIPPLEFDTGHLRYDVLHFAFHLLMQRQRTPREFRCSIIPRNPQKEALVRQLLADHDVAAHKIRYTLKSIQMLIDKV